MDKARRFAGIWKVRWPSILGRWPRPLSKMSSGNTNPMCLRRTSPHYSRFLRKWRSGTNLPAAADGSVAPRHPRQPHECLFQQSGPGNTFTARRLRLPGLPLRCELSCARVKQAFMKIRGKKMTLCRSRGEIGGARPRPVLRLI